MPRSKTILIKIFHYFSRYSSQYAKTFRKTFGYYCTSCHNRPRSQDDTRCNNTIHTDPRVISYCYRCRIIFPLIINIMVCTKDSHIRPELNIVSNINCACSLNVTPRSCYCCITAYIDFSCICNCTCRMYWIISRFATITC